MTVGREREIAKYETDLLAKQIKERKQLPFQIRSASAHTLNPT